MKLSPEAKQAIKTAIEQLRLLLVDDAMDTVREEVGRHLMDDGKGDCSCQIAHTGNCESNRQVVLEAPELEVSCSNPFEEIQTEIKQLKAQVERLTMQTSCNLQASVIGSASISNQAEKRPDTEALEVEKVISAIIRNAASSEILRQLS
ncbi:TPA: hypothetical protein G9F27_002895 [Salmonella enterica]|uniref:Uncharacterized protein n=1 Tax=Salmonella enterica TaxID=28901 RepID=A0A743P607_SALER|nr:hypothetical protein [Salmonella enterica]